MVKEDQTDAELLNELLHARQRLAELERSLNMRELAEEALRETQELYRDVFDIAPLAFVIWDLECRITNWNRAAERIFGWSREEVLGKDFFKFLIPKSAQFQVDTVVTALLQNELPNQSINENLTKSGKIILCEWNNAIRYDSAGRPIGAISLGSGITERRRAEERLRFLSSAVEQTTEGVAMSDLGGNLLFVNNAFASLHGYTPDELVGKHLSIFHTSEQMQSVDSAIRQLHETGEFSGEIWHARRDGTPFPALMQNSILRDEKGNPIGMIGTLRDISKRRLAEERLKETNQKLMELESLKEDLVNMVVHDMKNPVSNTMMALDMIKAGPDSQFTKRQKEDLGMAKRNQFKLSGMITNLLEISRLENNQIPIRRVSLDLAAVIERIVERYSEMVKRERKIIRISIDSGVRSVVCDEWLLERIVSNLLSNAIKHSYPKGKILFRAVPVLEQSGVEISVQDFGEGIPKEFQHEIFEKFYQVDLRELGHRSDTGLGLAFCKMAVEALGGKIRVESEPVKGSRFIVLLPEALVALKG